MARPDCTPIDSQIAHPGLTRRAFVSGASWAGFSLIAANQTVAQTPPATARTTNTSPAVIVQPSDLALLDTRTKIVLELSGQLRVKEGERSNAAAEPGLEVKAKSTLEYLEKITFARNADSGRSQPLAAARRYFEAGVENWVSGSAATHKLRPDCSETRLMSHNGLWQQYCERNPLDLREVQLLQAPINSASLELLLPRDPAKSESSWTIRAEDAAILFNLDAVHKSQLSAKVTKVEKGVATIELTGQLDATANSVPTRLDIHGNCQVKQARQCSMVTWVGLVIKEDRQVSQAEPGFAITARVRLIREESDAQHSVQISESALRQLPQEEDDGRWLVRLHSTAGRFSMLADRRWHIHRDSAEEAILRMVENNTVLAQCTVSRLSELEPGQQLTMEGLQSDIKLLLGTGFREFLESSEKVTSTNLRCMRIVVAGELEEVPIQWIYTHLSDDSGRRLALVFTMGGTVTDRFGAADEQMAGSFDWLADMPQPQEAAAATPPSSPPKLTAGKPQSAPKRVK